MTVSCSNYPGSENGGHPPWCSRRILFEANEILPRYCGFAEEEEEEIVEISFIFIFLKKEKLVCTRMLFVSEDVI